MLVPFASIFGIIVQFSSGGIDGACQGTLNREQITGERTFAGCYDAVFGIEHLLAVTMKGVNLERFLNDRDTVTACVAWRPDVKILELASMRQLRSCSQMRDDMDDVGS